MPRSVRLATLVLFIVASLSVTPTTQALPRDWYVTNYYDCDMNLVGYHILDCGGGHTYWGQQTGAYKEHYQEECSTGNPVEYSWWYNNGGTWVTYTGQSCP